MFTYLWAHDTSSLNWEYLFDQLAEHGFVVIDDYLSQEAYLAADARFTVLIDKNDLEKAGVGAKNDKLINVAVRGDYISWLKTNDPDESTFLALMTELRALINQHCWLNLGGQEFHFATYPPLSFYSRHFDQFKENTNRKISFVLYMNEAWQPEHAGELRVYTNDGSEDLAPIRNRLVLFRSDVLEHEVLLTHVERKSITGWFLYKDPDLLFLG
ncbi:MAG: 2OG-Fe(II) oxygenase [Bacteroidia bacterium]